MKLYKLIIFIIAVSLYSCKYDYEVDLGEFTTKVVVNSVINPDSTVKATLFWSRHTNDTSDYKVVDRFTAILYEDNSVIFDGEGMEGVLTTAVYPKEGAKYRLEIDVPQYGKLSAETSIPLKPTIDLSYEGVMRGGLHGSYYHFIINKMIPNSDTRSLIIRIMNITTGNHVRYSNDLYVNNAFCDQFNAAIDTEDIDLTGSSMIYEKYLRIPYKNIHQAIPLKFSVAGQALSSKKLFIDYDDYGFPIYETHYKAVTEIIAPSKEYDKHNKSGYQQNGNFSIFGAPNYVLSNIENGLGIFAGYSSVFVTTQINLDE